MLGDVDRQQSTQSWLRVRSEQALPTSAPIVGWAVDPKRVLRPPPGVSLVILDTPGGLHGFDLAAWPRSPTSSSCPSAIRHSIASRAASRAELMALPAWRRALQGRRGQIRLDARARPPNPRGLGRRDEAAFVPPCARRSLCARPRARADPLRPAADKVAGGPRAMEAARRLARADPCCRASAWIRAIPPWFGSLPALRAPLAAAASSSGRRRARTQLGRAASRRLVSLAHPAAVSPASFLKFRQAHRPPGIHFIVAAARHDSATCRA